MYIPKQNRRKLLKSLVALSLTGTGMVTEAAANPLLSAISIASNLSIGWRLRGMVDDLLDNNKSSDSTTLAQYQVAREMRSLILVVPPSSEVICAEIQIYVTNLDTGIPQLITQETLWISASYEYQQYVITIPAHNRQGLYQFDAVIPNHSHSIDIEGTQPVLLL